MLGSIAAAGRRRGSGGTPPPLGNSIALTASGNGIGLSLADGVYTVTTTSGSDTASYVASADDALAGDYVAEIEVLAHANGLWAGFDNAAPAARGYMAMDELVYLDAGFGAGKANYYKNGSPEAFNAAFGPKLYMARVGLTVRFYSGTDWATASGSPPIIASTAVDGGARSFQLGLNAAGLAAEWKVRVVDHP